MAVFIDAEGERMPVGALEVALADVPLLFGRDNRRIGDLGSGVAFYREGKFLGYHCLPKWLRGAPLKAIVETDVFLSIYGELFPKEFESLGRPKVPYSSLNF